MAEGHAQDLRTWMVEHPDWLGQLAGQTALVEGDGIELAGTVEVTEGPAITVLCDQECGFAGDARTVTVSVFCPDAYFRLAGTAVADDDKRLRCGQEMTVERIERRRWPRARLDLPVTLCPLHGTEIDSVPGRTVDISVGGACVETLSPVEHAERGDVKVVIRMAEGADIECSCATIAIEEMEDGWRYRLSFRDLGDDGAARLEKLTAV